MDYKYQGSVTIADVIEDDNGIHRVKYTLIQKRGNSIKEAEEASLTIENSGEVLEIVLSETITQLMGLLNNHPNSSLFEEPFVDYDVSDYLIPEDEGIVN